MKYNVLISGIRFEWLLCSVYAASLAEATTLAEREVEPGEIWRVVAA